MTVSEFIAKWQRVELTERSASQQHFLDLCELFEHPKPADLDPLGEWFTFERGADKHGGGKGWADVWKREFFGWEYKGKHKNLDAAYNQLLKYREALENPPLLVVCDMDRIVIHTNFTATVKKVYEISLAELGAARNIEIMRQAFHDPERLRPGVTSEAITTEVARRLAQVAQGLRTRGLDPSEVARFLDRIVFCLFAEDVGLLPKELFSRIVQKSNRDGARFQKLIGQLFDAMMEGGDFGLEEIRRFNGNLFTESPALELTPEEIDAIQEAGRLDWGAVDPSIFGTLFERGLDPEKRSQLGAQYTSREDIETLIEPVVMRPLREEWQQARQEIESLLRTGKSDPSGKAKPLSEKAARERARAVARRYLERLSEVRVLDPACGSGNFLYVTLQKLKDLEKEALVYASDNQLGAFLPMVGPWQFYGIEVNPYAFDLAQTTVWIGYLQWIRANGFGTPPDPVLRRMDENFRCMDAIIDLSDPDNPREPEWPAVEFIVGNPPFLGGKRMRAELGDEYVNKLFEVWEGRVPSEADLVCYWFEKARKHIEEEKCKRAGLLATQGIRGGANREVLKRIKETGDIFFAESDRNWILNGANVHISMVGFDAGSQKQKTLDQREVISINSNLTAHADVTTAKQLKENFKIAFQGPVKVGKFEIENDLATKFLLSPNPHSRPNSDILFLWVNGLDITKRPRSYWIIDFGSASLEQASKYQEPFEYVQHFIKPDRIRNADRQRREFWWRLGRSGGDWKSATQNILRTIFTPRVSKHRLFTWFEGVTLPDSAVVGFARSDDYFFGLLHSRLHEVWALKLGTRLETRPRYTATTCFETFPFPHPTPEQEANIAQAAKYLDDLRSRWLNPPEWTREEILEFPGSTDGPWARYVHDPDERGIGTVRYPRLVPKDEEAAKQLARRTLTNLYNQRPTWLDLAHKSLDQAVFAAYGWDASISDDEILARLLALNLEREPAKRSGE
ncbi:MAG TPA: DNA methyltransferase [Blastocatellia bacterium]|nr:DNA methyltransferase [Blastocatellia bacterium]